MNEDFRTLVMWLLGALSGILTLVGGFIFKKIFDKLKDLETDHNKHKESVNLQFAKIEKELAINAERDNANYESIMAAIHGIKSNQDEMKQVMKEWQKNIENFYYHNPELKKPDA